MPEKTSRPLTIKIKDFQKNTVALFKELEEDKSAREQFIKDPIGQLSSKVLKRELGPQRASDANRVLFSMLANDKFLGWLDNYVFAHKGEKVSKDQFSKDFATALVQYGDHDLFVNLFKLASDGFGLPGFSNVAEQLICGPDGGAATPAATPSTSDQTAHSSSNANGIAFGDPRVVDPAAMRAIVEQVIAYAKEQARQAN